MIEDLLLLADDLTRREQRRPKQVSLRRAVATAYYAVFHAPAKCCADQLVGYSKPWTVYTPVYRMLDHATARRFFERARRSADDDRVIAKIGLIFVKLHEARTTADYLPEPFAPSRQDVREIVDEAREAVKAIEGLPGQTKLHLAVHLIAKAR